MVTRPTPVQPPASLAIRESWPIPNRTPQLDFKTTEPVRAAIAAVGRTEDLRFSPSNRLLAIAAFDRGRCLILRIQVELTPDGPTVAADDFMELASDGMRFPHGLDFIDDQTLVVANREGRVSILRLPPGELAGRQCDVEPLSEIRGSFLSRVRSPGAVAARHEPGGLVTILVCNNYSHRVTRHVVDPRAGYEVLESSVLLRRSLKIPDGIALSHDGRWIAVSSHATFDVKMFDTAGKLGRKSTPTGTLCKANYPHGLCFSANDRHIFVADAGSPVIHIYHSEAGWNGNRDPVHSVVVLDDDAFARGRTNKEEGGPKGIDIDRSNQVIAITCGEQPLVFYPLRAITGMDPAV